MLKEEDRKEENSDKSMDQASDQPPIIKVNSKNLYKSKNLQ